MNLSPEQEARCEELGEGRVRFVATRDDLKAFLAQELERQREEIAEKFRKLPATKARNLWEYEMVVTQDAINDLAEALTPASGAVRRSYLDCCDACKSVLANKELVHCGFFGCPCHNKTER